MMLKVAICVLVVGMAKPGGSTGSPPSHVGPMHGERSGTDDRKAYRLGEDMFRHGILRGTKDAQEGLDFSQEMAKNPGLIPAYAFVGAHFDPNALGSLLLKRMADAPPHLRTIYYQAFVAGYELGHTLNLPRERQIALLSLDCLLRIGSALRSYAVERNPKIPRMINIASLKRALVPLMGVRAADFVNPYTNQPYGINSSLSGKDYADLQAQAPRTVFAFEATQAPDGTRGVLFINGEAVRVPEQEWDRLKKTSGIK